MQSQMRTSSMQQISGQQAAAAFPTPQNQHRTMSMAQAPARRQTGVVFNAMNADGGLQSVGELTSDAGRSRRSAVRADLRHTTDLNMLEVTQEQDSNEDSDGEKFD